MPVGFQVIGDSGVFQIDGGYCNLQMAEKGSVVTNASAGVNGSSYSFPARSDLVTPILMIGGGNYGFVSRAKSGSSWGLMIAVNAPIGTSVPYYIFDQPPQSPPAHGYGLQVLDQYGRVLFDAEYAPMRVVSFGSVASAATGAIYTGTAGRTYAVANLIDGFRANTVEIYSRVNTYRVNGASVEASPMNWAKLATSPTQTAIRNGSAIVVDVTGF